MASAGVRQCRRQQKTTLTQTTFYHDEISLALTSAGLNKGSRVRGPGSSLSLIYRVRCVSALETKLKQLDPIIR